jgi:hypothetical protein
MTLSRLRKTYYIVLCIFLTVLVASFSNLAQGGAVLWSGQNLFYITVFLVCASVFYVIASSRSDSFSWVEACAISAFCLSLFLVVWVGSGPLPYDLDSILYMHSISFTLQNGVSLNLIRTASPLISNQYGLPMQSMLGAALVLVTNASYITVAKYLPLLLMCIFLVIYYPFASERFGTKVALISLAPVASFLLLNGYANTFNDYELGTVFFLLSLSLVFMRDRNNQLVLTMLVFFIIGCFVLTHDLSFVIFIAALAILVLKDQILRIRYPELNLPKENVINIFLVAVVAVFIYFTYVFFGPIQTIVAVFANRLAIEVTSATPVSTWALGTLIERLIYGLFIGVAVILALVQARADSLRFFSRYADFFLLGAGIFALGVVGALVKVPFNWDRISIFGWFFLVPVTLAMLFERRDRPILTRRGVIYSFSAVLVAALVFGNVLALPTNILDHTGANDYTGGTFKDWTKPQEFDSALWTIHYKNSGTQVVGDELVRRLYLSNSPNFTGNFEAIQYYNNGTSSSSDSIILIRNENLYQIIWGFYPTKGSQPQLFSAKALITNLLGNQSLYRVYDDGGVRILYSPPP